MASFGQGGPPGGMPPGYPPGSPGAPPGYGQHPHAPAQPMGQAPQPGYPAQAHPGQGYPGQPHPGQPQGYPPQGYPPQGYPPQGHHPPQAPPAQHAHLHAAAPAAHPGAAPGYAPAPGYPAQNAGYAQAQPGAMQAPAAAPSGKTVFGIPLNAGERVIYFEEGDYLIDIIVSWILAVVLLPVLVGFYFAYKAITYRASHPKVWILTSQRILVVEGSGETKIFYYHRDVRDIEAQRRKRDLVKNDGGGLLGNLMEAAANAAVNHVQNQVDKTAKLYWEDCEIIWLLLTNGQREKFDPPQKSHVGMMLARVMFQNSGNDEYEAEYKEAAPT